MNIKKRFCASSLIMTFLIILVTFSIFLEATSVECADEYIYYGVIPKKLNFYQPVFVLMGDVDLTQGWYTRENLSATSEGLVSVIALKDGTNVRIYTLPDNKIVSEALDLKTMEKHYVTLQNGTVFKVVSNQLVYVQFTSTGMPNATSPWGPEIEGFITATNGAYVGKEFIFIATQSSTNIPYRIHALESSQITIYDENGSTFTSLTLKANEYKNFAFSCDEGYRVVSTGNIMIQSNRPGDLAGAHDWSDRSYTIPSVNDGFMGKFFFSSMTAGDTTEEVGFMVSAPETSKVKIWDVVRKQILQEFTVEGGSEVEFKYNTDEVMVESDKPVSFAYIHNGSITRSYAWAYGTGVNYIGVKANEVTTFVLPSESGIETYIFAYEDTIINIDDITMSIKADTYFIISTEGFHKILSDKNVGIEIIHWPSIPPEQGLSVVGVVIPCIQAMNVTTDVTLTPLGGESFPITYIIIGAVAVVAIAVAGFMIMKRRPKK